MLFTQSMGNSVFWLLVLPSLGCSLQSRWTKLTHERQTDKKVGCQTFLNTCVGMTLLSEVVKHDKCIDFFKISQACILQTFPVYLRKQKRELTMPVCVPLSTWCLCTVKSSVFCPALSPRAQTAALGTQPWAPRLQSWLYCSVPAK